MSKSVYVFLLSFRLYAACIPEGIIDFSGGTTGNSLAANSALTNSVHGLPGDWSWSVTNGGPALTYLTAAHGTFSGSPTFCTGGTVYTDTSTVGVSYDVSKGGNQFAEFILPTNQGAMDKVVAGVWFSTNRAQNSTQNSDIFTIYATGSFNNVIFAGDGSSLRITCEFQSGGCTPSQNIPIASDYTRLWITILHVTGGALQGQVFAEGGTPGTRGSLLGSWSGSSGAAAATKVDIGDAINLSSGTGTFRFDHLTICYGSTCSFPATPNYPTVSGSVLTGVMSGNSLIR